MLTIAYQKHRSENVKRRIVIRHTIKVDSIIRQPFFMKVKVSAALRKLQSLESIPGKIGSNLHPNWFKRFIRERIRIACDPLDFAFPYTLVMFSFRRMTDGKRKTLTQAAKFWHDLNPDIPP